MFKRMSIQMRVILPVALILIVICVTLTVGIYSASKVATVSYTGDFVLPEDSAYNGEDIGVEIIVEDGANVVMSILAKSLWLMLGCIVLGVASVWLVVKLALRPVMELSRQISQVNERQLNCPVTVPESKDEIAELAVSFNRMLSHLNSSFEAQKRFSATAAHELKTPLSSIIANVEVLDLDKHPTYEECLETITLVKDSAARMEHLVLDLLHTYSTGEIRKKEACNLREICEKNCEAQAQFDQKGISYEITGELSVQGDPLLLDRAVGNLISNAFRYNRAKGSVRIRLADKRLRITDTGIGIPEEHLERIFEPFYRVDVSRSRILGGSGLGLSITKQIFDNHNADIIIDSQTDKGTDIQIFFEE